MDRVQEHCGAQQTPLTPQALKEAFFQSGWSLRFVYDWAPLLKEHGLYETSLLEAYAGCKTNWRSAPLAALDALFQYADRDRLRAAGDPLPTPLPAVVYRGVGGTGRARRIRGVSWTGSLACACWFATRVPLPDPAVYQITLPPSSVLAYVNDRHEDEYLVEPLWLVVGRPRRMRLTPDALTAGKEEWVAAREKRRAAR
jgi:hypothetical protein